MSRVDLDSAFADYALYEPTRSPLLRLAKHAAAIVRAWNNRRQVARLLHFDDHMLRDIGLSRSDVTGALALPFGDDPSVRLAAVSRERQRTRRSAYALRRLTRLPASRLFGIDG